MLWRGHYWVEFWPSDVAWWCLHGYMYFNAKKIWLFHSNGHRTVSRNNMLNNLLEIMPSEEFGTCPRNSLLFLQLSLTSADTMTYFVGVWACWRQTSLKMATNIPIFYQNFSQVLLLPKSMRMLDKMHLSLCKLM